MTTAVDVDLAASILCMWHIVRARLEEQQPRLGHIAEQARGAWSDGDWHKASGDVIRHLAGDVEEEYSAQLGALVNATAAAGLAAGMDLLLARGWHPEVAWQRALSGFGLDARRMRGLMAGVTPTPNASGAGASEASARTAVRSLLAYAETLARTEIKAWSNVRQVAKAYDPDELRDYHGRWATTRGARVKAKEKEADPLAGVSIAEEAPTEAPAEPDRYAALREAPADRYAALRNDRYAALRQPTDRYAALRTAQEQQQEQATGQTTDRYAALRPDRYAALKPKRAPHREVQTLVFFKTLGEKEPEPLQTEAIPRSGRIFGHYVPMSDMHGYYTSGSEMPRGHVIFFGDIADHGSRAGREVQIAAKSYDSPFDAVEPADALTGIRDDDWDTALNMAAPIWDRIWRNPEDWVYRVDEYDMKKIAEAAGYGPGDVDLVRKTIMADAALRRVDEHVHDGNLIEAMADHIVWKAPEVLTRYAEENHDPNLEDDADDLKTVLSRIGQNKLRSAEIPVVVDFQGGFHPQEVVYDMRGGYQVHRQTYQSAIGTYMDPAGHGKIMSPKGVIGLLQITTQPAGDFHKRV